MNNYDHNDAIEARRVALQAELDAMKSATERNRLGQFATPTKLARDVLAHGVSLLEPATPIRFLDPAIGTGSFYSALLATSEARSVISAIGFEIDEHYGAPGQALWAGTPLKIILADFTQNLPPVDENQRATLLICNPPYVRHHHLSASDKERLHVSAKEVANVDFSGLSGLYCYFMALANGWMSEGAIAGWLIPSEFMDVNYGHALKAYLLREVTLLQIHRFDPNDVQFDDALVSSAVVWFENKKPLSNHRVTFSYGGTMQAPTHTKSIAAKDLNLIDKWTKYPKSDPSTPHDGYRLGDLFAIKRGIATGDNNFFIVAEDKARSLNLPARFLRPVLPSARYVKSDEVLSDAAGMPLLEKRLFLIDCDRPEDELKCNHPELWAYLQTGIKDVATRFLCSSRRLWYSQERRPAAPIVCTYMGRSDHDGRPFRFILNQSEATATNVYLMLYPKPLVAKRLARGSTGLRLFWEALNSIDRDTLLGNGRVYGGGLHKLEPKELANVPADHLAALLGLSNKPLDPLQYDFNEVFVA